MPQVVRVQDRFTATLRVCVVALPQEFFLPGIRTTLRQQRKLGLTCVGQSACLFFFNVSNDTQSRSRYYCCGFEENTALESPALFFIGGCRSPSPQRIISLPVDFVRSCVTRTTTYCCSGGSNQIACDVTTAVDVFSQTTQLTLSTHTRQGEEDDYSKFHSAPSN